MRKALVRLMCCLLVFAFTIGPVFAQTDEMPVDLITPKAWPDDPSRVRSQCAWQDGLALLVQHEGLYTWSANTKSLELALSQENIPPVSWLVPDGATLWGFEQTEQTLLQLLPQSDEAQPKLRLKNFPIDEEQGMPTQPEALFISGSHLFALFRPEELKGYQTRLLAWRMSDGALADIQQPEHLQAITPGENGQLMGLVMDAWAAANTSDADARKPQLLAFDPFTGTEQSLGSLREPIQEYNLIFSRDRADDSILYNSDNKVIRRDASGREQLSAYMNADFFAGIGERLVALPGKQFSALDVKQATLYQDAQSQAPDVLTVFARMNEGSAHQKAMDAIQGFGINRVDRSWEDDSLLPQLLQNGTADLLFLHSAWDDLPPAVKKGSLMDLSGSEVISRHIKRCYPFLQEQSISQDGIYLVPVDMDVFVDTANIKLFDQLGIKIPTTFEALCGFLETWQADFMDDYPDYIPYADSDPAKMMLFKARDLVLADQAFHQQDFRFDTPLMRALLSLAKSLSLDDLNRTNQDNSWYHQPTLMASRSYALFNITLGEGKEEPGRELPVLIKPSPEMEGTLPCHVYYLAINARAQNQHAALAYIERYILSLEDKTCILLYPDENTPLQHPWFERYIQKLSADEENLKKQIEQAAGAERSNLQQALDSLQKQIAQEEKQRYWISAESIAQYRQDMQRAYVYQRSQARLLGDHEFTQIMDRWLAGQLDLDGFLRESDQKLRLMRMEGE